MPESVSFIEGKSFADDRGNLNTVNDFDFRDVKRFYQIKNSNTSIIRAWQGHKIEHKYFYAAEGKFLIAWVKIDNFDNPSKNLIAQHRILSVDVPGILSVPPGYANGIKAQSINSVLLVYSNLTLQKSEKDRWSYDNSLWLNWANIK